MQLSVPFFKVAVFFQHRGYCISLDCHGKIDSSFPILFSQWCVLRLFLNEAFCFFSNPQPSDVSFFQEATLNFSIVNYWSPRITESSQVCWIFKQLVAILVRLGALSFKHIFFPKIISKNEKSSLKVKLLHVLLCCELEGLLHIVLLRKVVTILKWNSQNCFWLSEMF